MERIGKYIYGVIPRLRPSTSLRTGSGQVNSNPTRIGLPNPLKEGPNSQEFFGPYGISSCEEVYTISYQDIQAVVSDCEIVDYTFMRKDVLARLLVRHQKVIERIMSFEYTIIPMRLGIFAKNQTEVKDILNKGYRLIKDVAHKINEKVEIDVSATWSDFNTILKEAGEEKEIKEFKEKLLANPKGVTLEAQMKAGAMVKKALDGKRQRCASKIQDTLMSISEDSRQHELMDDKMVINSAFLIEKYKQKDFDRKVEKLNTEFGERLNFRCVGPLPPYSFYTLEIKKMEFKDLDWARKKLELNIATSKDEIRKAYQRQAFSLHPDKNPNVPGIEREFDEVTKAYKTLWEYCQGEKCSFDEEEFKKNSILVKVMFNKK